MMMKRVSVMAAAITVGMTLVGCPASDNKTATNKMCITQQPLSALHIKGTSLGAKKIALTFDDGPAPRTRELSTYLKSRNIRAAFFVNGNMVTDNSVLTQLVADGHVVANHTQTHKSLTDDFSNDAQGNAAIVKEVTDTDAIIAPFVPNGRFMFRAPFGAFDTRTYEVLHASPMDKYVGHIDWDIGAARTETTAADWACWQNEPKLTTKACGDLYIQETNAAGKGIILLHDPYGDANNHAVDTGVGNTVDMVKYMVPLLETAGYSFVRIDEVPEIAALLPPLPDGGVFIPDAGPPPSHGEDGGTTTTPPTNNTSGSPTPSPTSPPPDPCGSGG